MKRSPERLLFPCYSRGEDSARQESDSRRFIQRCQLYLIKSGKAQNRVNHAFYSVTMRKTDKMTLYFIWPEPWRRRHSKTWTAKNRLPGARPSPHRLSNPRSFP